MQNDLEKARGKDSYLKARKDLKAFVSLWSTTGFGKGCFLLFPAVNDDSPLTYVSTQVCLIWAFVPVILIEESLLQHSVSLVVTEIVDDY